MAQPHSPAAFLRSDHDRLPLCLTAAEVPVPVLRRRTGNAASPQQGTDTSRSIAATLTASNLNRTKLLLCLLRMLLPMTVPRKGARVMCCSVTNGRKALQTHDHAVCVSVCSDVLVMGGQR